MIGKFLFYCRILVLSNGNLMEFDTPQNLINKTDSIFADLVKKSKITS